MTYHTFRPPPHLAAYVRYFWVLEGAGSDTEDFVYRSMADGCVELLFHYQGIFDEVYRTGISERSFCSGIHGQTQHFRNFSVNGGFGIFGVYLYPFALPLLFSCAAADMTDQMVDLYAFLGAEGNDLTEGMMLAKDTAGRILVITRFLEKRLDQVRYVKPGILESIQTIVHADGNLNVQQLAAQSCLSMRQFERVFKTYSGLSPKLFQRINRFQSAIAAYPQRAASLTDIAYECGYYDQSHFIHDFKIFSGHHPRKFFSGATEQASFFDLL